MSRIYLVSVDTNGAVFHRVGQSDYAHQGGVLLPQSDAERFAKPCTDPQCFPDRKERAA